MICDINNTTTTSLYPTKTNILFPANHFKSIAMIIRLLLLLNTTLKWKDGLIWEHESVWTF